MKKFLNSLRDFRTYTTEINIIGIDEESKNPKKGNLILFLGNIPNEDLVETLNTDILSYTSFRSIYKPRNYYSQNKKVKQLNMQKEYYNLLPQLGLANVYDTRLNVSAYMGRNLIIDITDLVALEAASLSNKRLGGQAQALKAVVESLVAEVGYETNTLFVGASTKSTAVADGRTFNDNFTLITRFLRRHVDFLPKEGLDNLVFFNSEKRHLLKVALTEANRTELFEGKSTSVFISRLLRLASGEEGLTPEEEKLEPPTGQDLKEVQPEEELTTGYTQVSDSPKPSRAPLNKKAQAEADEKAATAVLKALTLLPGKPTDEQRKNLVATIEKTLANIDTTHLGTTDDELLDVAMRANPDISEQILTIVKGLEIGTNNVKRQHARAVNREKSQALLSSAKLKDIIERGKSKSIEQEEVQQMENINPELNKRLRSNAFDKAYAEKKFMNDIVRVFTNFSEDSDIPLDIIDFQVEETSDDQTSKETIYVTLRDDLNVQHKITIDLPKVYEGKYIRVNGGKKIINKMFVMLPIVKTKPNEVWITTDYNKLIIERFGRKINSQVDYLGRVIEKLDFRNYPGLSYRRGNSLTVNGKYQTSLEYSELSQRILSLSLPNYTFVFNQKLLRDEIEEKGKQFSYDTATYFPVGFYKRSTVILSKITTGELTTLTGDGTYKPLPEDASTVTNVSTFLITKLDEATEGALKSLLSFSVKANESLTYSRVKIVNKRVPMIVLLAYEVGLFDVLNRYGIEYKLYRKEPRLSIRDNKAKIKFADAWLVYDTSKVRNTLLLGGLRVLDTDQYDLVDFNGKEPYLDYFQTEFNSRNVAKGIHNAMTLLLDPVTKEILAEMNLPTNVIDLLLTANTMLEDLEAKQFNDLNIYRMRGTEQIPALLYKIIADSYRSYKDSMNNRNPTKLSVPKNILIKNLMELSTVDEASDLNPSLEIDKQTSVTYRGVSGRNSADSYTEEIRGFDKSMEGILSILTPDSATVGIVRQLSTNPNIKSVRGFLDTSGDTTDPTSVYSPVELLNNYTSRHADPPRVGINFVCHLTVTLG